MSITKSENVEWDEIKPNILSIITDFLTSHDTIDLIQSKTSNKKYSKKEQEIVDQIEELIEERIKPAVAQDGGDIRFIKFEKGIVFLEMREHVPDALVQY